MRSRESRADEWCAAARITTPTPTQTQCLTNTGNNESNNINTLRQTTASDLASPPHSHTKLQKTPEDAGILVSSSPDGMERDKRRNTFQAQKAFRDSQECQNSVTGFLNIFIGFGHGVPIF